MAESIAMTDKLDYSQLRRRAVAARAIKMVLPASNGSSFSPGQSIIVALPSNLENTFIDLSKTYLRFKLTNSSPAAGGNANDATLDGASGAYCLFDRLTVSSGGGAVINDITGYNVLVSALMSTHSTKDYNMNIGSTMLGTATDGGAHVGATVAQDGGAITVCLPLAACGIAQLTPQKYLPAFSRSNVQLQYYLDSMVNSVASGGTPVLALTDVELVTTAIQLSPEAGRMIDEMVGGRYTMLMSDYRGTTASVTGTGAAQTHVSTLGFSFSSLDRVFWVARSADSQTQANNSIGARSNATTSEYSLTIAGVQYPDRPVVVGGAIDTAGYGAGAMAELLVALGGIGKFSAGTQLNTGQNYAGAAKYGVSDADGSNEAKTGSFVAAIECESMEGSSGLFSGANSVSAITQMRHEFSALPAKNFIISYWANYTSQLVLDMRGQGVFTVSV